MEKIKLGDEITLYRVDYNPTFSKEQTLNSISELIKLQPENEGSDAFT